MIQFQRISIFCEFLTKSSLTHVRWVKIMIDPKKYKYIKYKYCATKRTMIYDTTCRMEEAGADGYIKKIEGKSSLSILKLNDL